MSEALCGCTFCTNITLFHSAIFIKCCVFIESNLTGHDSSVGSALDWCLEGKKILKNWSQTSFVSLCALLWLLMLLLFYHTHTHTHTHTLSLSLSLSHTHTHTHLDARANHIFMRTVLYWI